MASDETIISVSNLTKTYRLFGHPADRVKQFLSMGFKKYHRDFRALANVSFDVRRGETIGVVGRNGSGKSTLLQLICGILTPSSGSVSSHGRVAALLELGAGFNPEFTGRENVYFLFALMGRNKKYVDGVIDEVLSFADIGDFLDEPVQTYSSGMFVRLAFSALVHLDADVLIIDEALAVGDEDFQRKCVKKLGDFIGDGGKCLILVSHNINQIERICSRVLWVENGRLKRDGKPERICQEYRDSIGASTDLPDCLSPNIAYSGDLDVISLGIFQNGNRVQVFEGRSSITIKVRFKVLRQIMGAEVIIGVQSSDCIYVSTVSEPLVDDGAMISPDVYDVDCFVPDFPIAPGKYWLRLGFRDQFSRNLWIGHKLCPFNVIRTDLSSAMNHPGVVEMPVQWSLPLSIFRR